MGKKLLLINPVNPNRTGLTVNRSGRFPPLGLGTVAALTPSDWDIEILDENFDRFRYKKADLVGLSSFTAEITRAYEIAGVFRNRGIPTVIGGVHVSMMPEEALQYVDTVAIGEAESTWPRFIPPASQWGVPLWHQTLQQQYHPVPQVHRLAIPAPSFLRSVPMRQ